MAATQLYSSAQHDEELGWLVDEAPMFHGGPEEPTQTYVTSYMDDREDSDSDEDASGSDSDGSDSSDEEDPDHPYNKHDDTQAWHNNGHVAYLGEGLQDSYLSTITADDDAPYLPPASASGPTPRLPSYLNPADLTPEAPDTFIFPQEMCVGDDVFDSPSSSNAHPAGRAIPATTPSARHRRAPARKYRDADSDEEEEEAEEDVYAESSADDASEDEYMPSPRVQKRRLSSATARKATTSAGGRKSSRAAPRHSYSPYPSSGLSSAPSPAASSSASSSSCAGRRAGSRNIQVFDSPPPPRGAWDKDGPRAYRCPYCAHVQANKRSPDMERHIRSHFRAAGGAGQQWVCCGVPVERADAYGVAAAAANGGGEWEFNGVRMVGGCHEDFSRMDALKRHWKNANNACVGDVQYARAS